VKTFERLLKKLQEQGNEIGIVTCLPKNYKKPFYKKVVKAKKEWLETHLKNIKFDKIVFLDYEDIKNQVNEGEDVLFDDEIQNRENWNGTAYDVENILEILRNLLDK
jgi:5'(3')-deoxyribonucleotidase